MSELAERERYVRRALSERLFAEQTVGELTHLPLGAIVVALLWISIPHIALAAWYGILLVAFVGRTLVRRRAMTTLGPDGRLPMALRVAIVTNASVWGLGFVLAAPRVSQAEVALMLLMICGLTAGATSTLLADAGTFTAYTIAMLGLSAIGVVPLLVYRSFVVALAVIIVYGLAMTALYGRLRAILLRSLNTEFDLERSRISVDHERAFLDQLVSNAPNPIVVLDAKQCVQRVNPAFERVFGFTGAELQGKPLDDAIVPEGESADLIQADILAGRMVQTEARRQRKDRSTIHVRIAAAQIPGSDSSFAVYDDISERTAMEQTLRESEARLFKTLASLPVGILVIDVDGVPFFANDTAKEMLGADVVLQATIEDVVRSYEMVYAGTSVPYPLERVPLVRALHGEETRVDDVEVRRPNGSITLEIFGSPIRDRNGHVAFGVAAFTDITERRRVAQALEAARVAAEEATAAKSTFLANMSHEIRTPLNGILGLAELMGEEDLTSEQRRSIELIISSGETLLHVINDILDFSKIEAGQLDIESTVVDLAGIVESTARLLMPKAVEKSIEIVTEIDAKIPPGVLGDPTRIRQVLTNLLGNAVKFTHRGEVVITLSLVTLDGDDARVRFGVRDTGTGIPSDKLETIFDPFRQADATTTRRYGGTGLGLSISRRLVELMDGKLEVASVLGAGSTFAFELDMQVIEAALPNADAATDLTGVRILMVDDNATNRRVMRAMLAASDADVAEAADGRRALEAMRDAQRDGRPYGLLITDLVMPELDGFELVGEMRADPIIARTPAVMVTSVTRRGDAQRCRDLSIDACLLKPASRSELVTAIRAAIGHADRERTARSFVAPRPTTTERRAIEPPTRRLEILLAEDNAVNQEVAAAMLRRRGHTVTIVENGRRAVDEAKAHRYDVILMDLQMPEMDGVEATGEIRRMLGPGGPRIVALTANALTGERERCLAAGMDGYLSKPFRSSDLVTVVELRGATPASGVPIVPAPTAAADLRGLRRDLELGGVAEIFDDIVKVYMRDAPMRMDALQRAVESGEARGIERAAHAFKSAAATIHAGRLAELLQELERNGRNGAVGDAGTRVHEIARVFHAVQDQLESLNGDRNG
ncbi:MAG TPA: response regulator [Gemmatimonadaceae bacterium]